MVLGIDSINDIIDDYNRNYKSSIDDVLGAYGSYPVKIEGCVRGLHITNSNPQLRDPHQNRIREIKRKAAIKALSLVTWPSNVKNFEDLFDWVYDVLRSNGVIKNHCLWVYDIALRMGQCMTPKIEPQKYVYLYKGAYEGAVSLNKIFPNGSKIMIKNNRAPISSFPFVLQRLGAIDIENIMCIYHP